MRNCRIFVVALATMAIAPSSVLADDPAGSTVAQDVDQALSAEGLAGPTAPSAIAVPSDGNGDVGLTRGAAAKGDVLLAMPEPLYC